MTAIHAASAERVERSRPDLDPYFLGSAALFVGYLVGANWSRWHQLYESSSQLRDAFKSLFLTLARDSLSKSMARAFPDHLKSSL